jgi:hypothetical protein
MRLSTTVICLLACCPPHAFAEEDECSKGYRDTTAAERAAMQSTLTAALAALPQPPAGWSLTADGEARGVQNVCRDRETQPLMYRTRRLLNRVDDASKRASDAVVDKVAAAQAAKQPRFDALQAELEEIGKKIGAAAEKGDFARIEALSKESDAVGAKLQALSAEDDQSAQIEADSREAARDTAIDIEVMVNSSRERIPPEAKPAAKPAGVQSAYRWSDEPAAGTQDHVLLLLGAWVPAENGVGTTPRAGAAIVTPSSVAIRIDADASRMQSVISAIRISDVAAMLR